MALTEDPEDRAARLRERRLSELERMCAAQDNAAGVTSVIGAIYGLNDVTEAATATGAWSARCKCPPQRV